jgi:nucleoside-diphosphate-sugar epimerase
LALDNLVDFLVFCSDQKKTPLAKNQIFLVADGEDISTTELIEKIAFSLNKKSRLIPVNSKIFFIFLKLIGKHKLYTRLFDSLQIDASKAINLLGWPPKVTIDQQLNKTKM